MLHRTHQIRRTASRATYGFMQDCSRPSDQLAGISDGLDRTRLTLQENIARQALRYAPGSLSRHDMVLISAASSCVGPAAIHIARRTGARSIAFTRSPNQVQALLNAGACHVVVGEAELITEIKRLTAEPGKQLGKIVINTRLGK